MKGTEPSGAGPADGSSPMHLTNTLWAGPDTDPNWSPDGQWIAYDTTMYGNWDVALADREAAPRCR